MAEAGIRCLCYAAPWHRIERERGTYEWGWMDEVMGHLRDRGFDPIADIIHHTSFPDWLDEGMANPILPAALGEFAQAFAERYSWVRRYTVFNEPFLTAFVCGHQGVWYAYGVGPRSFVPMLLNVGRAVCQVSELLIVAVPDMQLIHVETCESHQALDRDSDGLVAFLNHRRFLMHDLVLGRIGDGHPLYSFLSEHGFTPEDARWFAEHPAQIDVLGLDYYVHSEHGFHREGSVAPNPAGRGFAAVARDYVERYRLPVMLSETNIRGYSSDRLSWCKYMGEQCKQLTGEGVDFRGFC